MSTGRVAVGHPVDVASGVMFNTWTDLSIAGRVPILVGRIYSTGLLANRSGFLPLGPGWRLNFQMSLRQTLEGFVYQSPDGSDQQVLDMKDDLGRSGRCIDPRTGLDLRRVDPNTLKLVRFGNGLQSLQLVFRRRAAARKEYDLVSIQANDANRLDLTNDAWGRPVQLTQSRSGRGLKLEYNAAGLLSRVLLIHGQRELQLAYGYDRRARLVELRDRFGVLSTFEYDEADRMIHETKHTGSAFRFEYQSDGRCVLATGLARYEERRLKYLPGKTEVQDSHGATTTYEYNNAGQVTSVKSPLGAEETFAFNQEGKLISHTDANGITAKRTYDALGRFVKVEFPDGTSARLEYDDEHRVVAVTDRQNLTWRNEFDARGNLVRSIRPDGLFWTQEYDAYGQRVKIVDPDGRSFDLRYDSLGQNVVRIDWNGAWWKNDYDAYGRLSWQSDPLGGTTRYEYDEQGRMAAVGLPDGRYWRFQHDAAGRVVANIGPDGTTSRRRYNPCGQLVELTDPLGRSTRLRWDSEPGRLLEIRNPKGATYQMEYDADGRVARETFWDGRTLEYEWNAGGQCTAVTDAAGRRQEYEFDEWGKVLARKCSDGTATIYERDIHNMPARIERAGTSVVFKRDEYARLLEEKQDGFSVRQVLDRRGRRIALETPLTGQTIFERDAAGACVAVGPAGGDPIRFERDQRGRERRRQLPGGGVLETDYDPMSVIVAQRYWRPGHFQRPAAIDVGQAPPSALPSEGSGFFREYQQDRFGHVSAVRDSLRGLTRFLHDPTGRLVGALRSNGPSELFGYDEAGNRSWSAQVGTLADAESLLSGPQPIYATNGTELILAADTRPGGYGERLGYGTGNRLEVRERRYGSVTYRYDAAGFLVEKRLTPLAGEERRWSYAWSGDGYLKEVTLPDGQQWKFEYDGLGRRVRKQGPGREVRYVWDLSVPLHELHSDRRPVTWTYEQSSYRPLAYDDGRRHHIICDGSGAASEVVSEDGRLEWTSSGGVWGDQGAEGAAFEVRHLGQVADVETGLVYNRFRYYDPEIGRYISPDPIGLLGGFNEYAYVPNPIEWNDPLGLSQRFPAGGPMATTGEDRGVTVTRNGETSDRTVPQSKCLATTTTDGGKPEAFVSGVPDNTTMTSTPRSDPNAGPFNGPANIHPAIMDATSGGPSGNWTHAEMHAMNDILSNPDKYAGKDVVIHIDRPPCRDDREGKGSCDHALEDLMDLAVSGENGPKSITATYDDEEGDKTYHTATKAGC